MKLTSIVAIYSLFWAFSFFLVLPFSYGRRDGEDAAVPGQATSAPPDFRFGRACVRTTIVSLVLFGLYYLNYVTGFVPVERLDLVPRRLLEGR